MKVLAYQMPKNPKDEWKTEVVCDDMHMTHNFDVIKTDSKPHDEFFALGGREGWIALWRNPDWKKDWSYVSNPEKNEKGVGEIREGSLRGMRFVASIEPMHGNQVCHYTIA